ncbi:MAG: hypothetical protein R2726_16975 [Acidimicrobiales bacterium]
MSEQGNRPWWWWVGVVLAGLVAVSVLVRLAGHEIGIVDTTAIIDGTHRSIDCVRSGVVRGCGFDPATQATAVNPYPLLQYLPATVFVALGASDDLTRTLLVWCNTAAVAGMVVIVARRAASLAGTGLAVASVVAMVTGMVLPYAGLSFGEPLVMLAVLVLCRLCLARRATPWLLVAAVLATVGKETLFSMVVLFAGGCILLAEAPGEDGPAVQRRKAAWVLGGVALGVAANLAFNVFRFGGVTNVQYLLEARPGPREAVVNAVSLAVAPNGGIVWFWWTAVAALVVVLTAVVAPAVVTGDTGTDVLARRRVRLGAAAVAGGFVVGLGSLAFWWGPFGWHSWGPRLLLPFVPPLILAAVELVGRPVGVRARRRWVLPVGAVALAGAVVLAVPTLAVVFAPQAWVTHITATEQERPECATVGLRGPEGYGPFHDCLMAEAWRTSSMPLVASVTAAADTRGPWFWLTAAGAALALGWWLAVVVISRRVGAPDRAPPEIARLQRQ